jgi:hypothetical protein
VADCPTQFAWVPRPAGGVASHWLTRSRVVLLASKVRVEIETSQPRVAPPQVAPTACAAMKAMRHGVPSAVTELGLTAASTRSATCRFPCLETPPQQRFLASSPRSLA